MLFKCLISRVTGNYENPLYRLRRLPDGMRRPVSSGMRYAPSERRALGAKRRPAMKKISTVQTFSNEILKEQKLTVGLDLGDRWSFYCVLDEAGKIILEQKVATTPEAMKQTFGKIPRSLIALGKPAVNRVGTRSD